MSKKQKQIDEALDLIFRYGQIDGNHHKAWVIDQVVRILTGDEYEDWVANYVTDAVSGEIYEWDEGIPP